MDPSDNFDNEVAVYPSRAERPAHLLGRSEWLRQGRKVPARTKPAAYARLPLYSPEQTRPYSPSPRTQAANAFWDTFVRGHNNGVYIRRKPEGGWWTEGSPEMPLYLGRADLSKHLSGKEVFGARGGARTRWGVIDLDLHAGDKDVFLDQFRRLLSALYHTDGWHYHVGAGGVHLCHCFPSTPLDVWRFRTRTMLREMDEQDPELAEQARRAGMKTLRELELYPDPVRGVRLPLSAGRTALMDRPLAPVVYRNRPVQDVIAYMGWLSSAGKQYMPVEQVLGFVNEAVQEDKRSHPKSHDAHRVSDLSNKHPPAGKRALRSPPSRLTGGSLKGRFACELVAFWSGERSRIDDVHTAIILTARMLYHELDDPQQAIDLLHEYVEALPALDSRSCQNPALLAKEIRSRVDKVYQSNGWQRDGEASGAALARTARAWRQRGFFLSRRETWGNARRQKVDFTEEEDATIRRVVPAVLKCDPETAVSAVKRFLGFVSRHSHAPLPMTAVPTILKDLPIKWGKNGKAGQFVRLLERLDWIGHSQHRYVPRGQKGTGEPRRYWIGEKMLHHFGAAGAGT